MKTKTNGHVFKDFDSKTYEELEKEFDVIVSTYETKKYGVQLTKDEYDFISTEVLENSKWKGTEVYAAQALRDIVIKLEPKKIILCDREMVRALFHFLNQYESIGSKQINNQVKTLETISMVIKEINDTEIDVRDASFELEAKKQGITPEVLSNKLSMTQEQLQ